MYPTSWACELCSRQTPYMAGSIVQACPEHRAEVEASLSPEERARRVKMERLAAPRD